MISSIFAEENNFKDELKEKIVNSWLENSARIDSYRFKYEIEFTIQKGMANLYYRQFKNNGSPALPDKVTTVRKVTEFIATPNKIKNSNYGDEYIFIEDKIFKHADNRIITDKYHFYFGYSTYLRPFPFAWFSSNQEQTFWLESSSWTPVKICTKPFSQELYTEDTNCNPHELIILSEKPEKKGLLKISVPTTTATNIDQLVMMVDPNQRYLPVRITYKTKDKSEIYNGRSNRWNITKWKLIDDILIPESWVYQEFSPKGEAMGEFHSKLTLAEINRPIPESEFQMKIPPGTKVENYLEKKFFVIQKDGNKRHYPQDAMNQAVRTNNFKIYKVLMNPKYNHLKTAKEIEKKIKKME